MIKCHAKGISCGLKIRNEKGEALCNSIGNLDCEHQAVETPQDQVNHPAHYADHYPMEVKDMIEVILALLPDLSAYEAYCLGNELKYRLRAGFKDENLIEQDIKKALFYNKERRGK